MTSRELRRAVVNEVIDREPPRRSVGQIRGAFPWLGDDAVYAAIRSATQRGELQFDDLMVLVPGPFAYAPKDPT